MREVGLLEQIALEGPIHDSVVAGGLLFMMFSCARASDAARVERLSVDVSDDPCATVWMQASVRKAKTATE